MVVFLLQRISSPPFPYTVGMSFAWCREGGKVTYRLRMMNPEDVRDLLQWLQRLSIPKARDGVLYFLEVGDPEHPLFIDLVIDGCDEDIDTVEWLSQILMRYILGHWMHRYVGKELAREHSYLNPEEIEYLRDKIYVQVIRTGSRRLLQWATFALENDWLGSFSLQLNDALNSILSDSPHEVHVDGLLRFRFMHYLRELQELTRCTVDDYLLSREYEDYIDLLRYFLDTTPTSQTVVHVLAVGESAKAFTENLQPFDVSEVENLANHADQEDLHPQDVLMSALITHAPQKVILHTDDADFGFAKTVVRVFGDRLEMCDCCPECDVFVAAIDKGVPSVYTTI
ncbi:hypothetical protein MM817_00304 [Acidibacillus sp. S0AB]|uniref:Sporulation protein YtxC n=1 Tax=Sulfoacidibacillus ferrooxidans TaxID=2005001 RepID=A0A9X1V8P3_9BACL|nr:hypothetical protein [Sulfoacidibacillus ferrooxidans]